MAEKTRAPRESKQDRLAREAFITLNLASTKLTAEVEALCRHEQIAMSHYVVLWFLARRREPDGVPMRAVIDGHLNQTSDSTRLADRLASLGMIERQPSANDRRVVLVRLTPKGRDVYVRLTRAVQQLHREQWSALTQTELRELRRLLVKALGEDAPREKLSALAAGDP